MAAPKFDHNHALFLHPSNNTGASIIPIQLIGSDSYSIWSRAMRIQLLGKNKLGIVDGSLNREDFGTDSVTPKLHKCVIYATSAKAVWKDLRERFDKNLLDEFASIIPPSCNCPTSKNFTMHLEKHKLVQFLMGLNENYDQSRGQVLIVEPTPTINKAYAMLIERESQRSLSSSMSGEDTNLAAFMAGKRMPN
nr:uncharacterized protein LOC104647469 [Solanum lycopersicum]